MSRSQKNTVHQPSRSNQEYVTVGGVKKRNTAYVGNSRKSAGNATVSTRSASSDFAPPPRKESFYPQDFDPEFLEEEQDEAIIRFLVEDEGETMLLSHVFPDGVPRDFQDVMNDQNSWVEAETYHNIMMETPSIFENVYADEEGIYVDDRGMRKAGEYIRSDVVSLYEKASARHYSTQGAPTVSSTLTDASKISFGKLSDDNRELFLTTDSARRGIESSGGWALSSSSGVFTTKDGRESGLDVERSDGAILRIYVDNATKSTRFEFSGLHEENTRHVAAELDSINNDEYLSPPGKATAALREFLDSDNDSWQ